MLKLGSVTKFKMPSLVLVFFFNFDLFKFSAAILEKGLLYIFKTPVQKEGNLPGFHIHTVCNLPLAHSSELNVIYK